jgi:hypothetical protein
VGAVAGYVDDPPFGRVGRARELRHGEVDPGADGRPSREGRGASSRLSPNRRALSASLIRVQSTTTVCSPTPAHSTKTTAAAARGPDVIAWITRWSENAAA